MSYAEEDYEYKGLRIRIVQDEDPFDPEDGDCPVYLVHFHRSLELCPDEVPFNTAEGFRDFLCGPDPDDYDEGKDDEHYKMDLETWEEDRKGWKVFLVSSYIHGGIALALAGSIEDARFPDRQWDVSHVGAILIKDDGEWWGDDDGLTDECAGEVAQSHVKAWNQYLNGEVYGYIVERPVTCEKCGHTEYEDLDSCWGFYGLDYCKEEAELVADAKAKED